jgi:probable metal-binding protein
MPMTGQVHGHEVMRMMVEAERGFTRETLRAAIVERFGEDMRFFTCSAEGMTADELIDFLSQRGKFIESSDGFTTEPEKICKH